jgi:hypothetical protein
VFQAFRAIEVAVRKKGKYADTDFGVNLMGKAFDPANGPLRDKTASLTRRKARQKLFEGGHGRAAQPERP